MTETSIGSTSVVVCPNCGWYGGRQAIDVG